MSSGYRLGRLFGVKIIIDWSWLFIFLFVTWSLTAGLSSLHPEWQLPLSLAIAVVAALLFFGSVLAHELAHARVALAHGLPVRNITLFLFGGVANIQREPPSPRAEFLIAIVGPIASFVLGGAFLLLGGMVGGLGAPVDDTAVYTSRLDPLSTVLLWLGSINIILAVFNLLPGFPLDGGRVLRSALWAATGDLRRATRWATAGGQIVAGLFIIAGFARIFGAPIPIFARGPIGGVWLILIGWFLFNAAIQSYRQVVVQDLLEGLPVSDFMRAGIPTIDPATSIDTLVRDRIIGGDDRAFPVVADDALVGLVCLEDVRKAPRAEWERMAVQAIMTPVERLVVAAPEEEVTEALRKLAPRDMSQIPVLQNGRLVGLLRQKDIARWLQLQGDARATT